MILVHSVTAENVGIDAKDSAIKERTLSILKDGLRSSADLGMKSNYFRTPLDHICFLAIMRVSHVALNVWGNYHFALREDYVKAHTDQFRECAELPHNSYFRKFLKDNQIGKPDRDIFFRETPFQIISLKPVPVEGLDFLVIGSHVDDEFIDKVKMVIPAHMGLYVGDYSLKTNLNSK